MIIFFSVNYIEGLPEVDGFLIKSASPSCGVRDAKLYDQHRRVVGRVDGLFTKRARSILRSVPIGSERGLLDCGTRRDFYIRIFMLARVGKSLERAMKPEGVVNLHRGLKYLLMIYHPGTLRELSKLVACRRRVNLCELKRKYKIGVMRVLARRPTNRSYASVSMYIHAHLKGRITGNESRYTLELIDNFVKGGEH